MGTPHQVSTKAHTNHMNSTPLAYTWTIGILATCIPLLLINKAYMYLHHLLALWNPSINPPTNINKHPFILTPISHHINPHHHTFHAHRYILHTHPLHHPLPPRICQLKSTTHTHYNTPTLNITTNSHNPRCLLLLLCGDIHPNPGPMPHLLQKHPTAHKRRQTTYFLPSTIKFQPEYQHLA